MELLAPAGDFDTARAAFAAGADAVYLGLDAFSARAQAVNFSADELRELLAYARAQTPRRAVYVTFNTLITDDELDEACAKLAALEEIGPDGVIVQDLGVARLIREYFPSLVLHASTQLVAHNLEDVWALRNLGFRRVVTARELSLADVRVLAERGGVEIETFVHGALCYSLSGLCLFSAMERNRSGNRGRCAYCCRLPYTDATGQTCYPFSMKDLRLDDRLDALKEAGVASLKIEGRMKSALYVATVTKHYRELLDGAPSTVSRADMETVFSRHTTRLYADGEGHEVIDPVSLGHLGTPIGVVKRVTKDREGRSWIRFKTSRALERHDGLQFETEAGGRPFGMGISEMRTALSRKLAFEVPAGTDVEVLLLDEEVELKAGTRVYCSMSNAVKRRFPIPPFRPSDYPIGQRVDVRVTLSATALVAEAKDVRVEVTGAFEVAQHPEKTAEAVRKAFSRLGETDWQLGTLEVIDPERRFAPVSLLNDLRRDLVEKLDSTRTLQPSPNVLTHPLTNTPSIPHLSVLKIRLDQTIPADESFDELVMAIGHAPAADVEARVAALEMGKNPVRLALPVFTLERDFARLRVTVRHLVRSGFAKWEAADLAGLELLKQAGVTDITADWTLYAFNHLAMVALREQGVTRFVISPEHPQVESFAEMGAEQLVRQSTPLFLSLTRPAAADPSTLTNAKGEVFHVAEIDGVWVTTREAPRTWPHVAGLCSRRDYSWDLG